MKKPDDEMLEQYDCSNGARGTYASRYADGSNVVVLDPDVAEQFKTPQQVNEALREQMHKRAAGD